MAHFRIRANWTNVVSETHEFTLKDLADAAVRNKLKWTMSDPERLRSGETRHALTERAAATFAALAHALRKRGHGSQAVAHFVNRPMYRMFAEDIGLLQDRMFNPDAARGAEQPGHLHRDREHAVPRHEHRRHGRVRAGGLGSTATCSTTRRRSPWNAESRRYDPGSR